MEADVQSIIDQINALEFSDKIDLIGVIIREGNGWMIASTIDSCSHSLFMRELEHPTNNLKQIISLQKKLDSVANTIGDLTRGEN